MRCASGCKPDRMAQLGITTTDVANVVKEQNQQFAVGRIGDSPTPYPVKQTFPVTTTTITEPAQFDNMILRASNQDAALVRVKDIGYADLGLKSYAIADKLPGQAGNPDRCLPAARRKRDSGGEGRPRAPSRSFRRASRTVLEYEVALDTTPFVQASIDEVIHTFFEAVVLVVLVVFIFLHSLRAYHHPDARGAGVDLGALIGMLVLGFSINMLTLFGMILAIGIVVDDAIVVVENTERNMVQFGLSPKDAAKRAMEEVSGPVIAIVLVLNAVFIPVAFLGGITGALYKQFAVTVAISVVFSGIVALTLSPALAAILIKAKHGEKKGFFKWFDITFDRITNGYVGGVASAIRAGRWRLSSSSRCWPASLSCSRPCRRASSRRRTRATSSSPSTRRTPRASKS